MQQPLLWLPTCLVLFTSPHRLCGRSYLTSTSEFVQVADASVLSLEGFETLAGRFALISG